MAAPPSLHIEASVTLVAGCGQFSDLGPGARLWDSHIKPYVSHHVPPCWLGLRNTQTAPLQRGKTHLPSNKAPWVRQTTSNNTVGRELDVYYCQGIKQIYQFFKAIYATHNAYDWAGVKQICMSADLQ